MKRIFTLFAAMALTLSLYANYGQSKLSISSTGSASIRVMVDGNKYRASNNAVMISNIAEGYHTVKVYQLQRSRGGFNGNASYNYQLVYNSRVFIKPQYFVDIVINRFGKAFVDEQLINSGYYNNDDDDWGDDWGNGNDQYNGSNTNQSMSPEAFEQFKRTVRNESFENTKLSIAKQAISNNYITSAQVKEITELFSFENNKLDFAKYAYKYTVDKGSYFMVNDAFSFSTSKEELMRYIQSVK